MKAWRLGLGCASLLLALTAANPAQALEPADLERAKVSFKAGANAYAAGDYLAAIQALDVAYELSPLPAIAFSLAQAERKQYAMQRELQHLQRALALFRRYVEQEPNGPRKNDALLAIAELSPQLSAAAPSEPPPPKPLNRPTRVMVVTDTPGARISLDGATATGTPLIREVTPGRHHAHVSASGYYDVERDITAVSGELILSEVQLKERPSPLYVWAPKDADIYVDGMYVGPGGALATIPLASGVHQLIVAQKGRRVVRRAVRLQRGQPHTELVTLEPTTQRFISELLFVGGGAALGAGVVLSALAVQSENDAEDFLRLRTHAYVLPPKLFAYHASLAERTRYRTAAAISVASSFGFFITGLFLRELDRPNLAASRTRELGAPRQEAATARRFTFSPLAATGDLGASLQVSF